MHRAGTALGDTAAVLGSREADPFPDHPQQWRVSININVMGFSIHGQAGHLFPPGSRLAATAEAAGMTFLFRISAPRAARWWRTHRRSANIHVVALGPWSPRVYEVRMAKTGSRPRAILSTHRVLRRAWTPSV